jgi:hypothetical protein
LSVEVDSQKKGCIAHQVPPLLKILMVTVSSAALYLTPSGLKLH